MNDTAKRPDRIWVLAAVFVLAGAAFATFANVWPESLVVDDRFFVGEGRFSGASDIPAFFTRDLWAGAGVRSGHYRPVLLLSIWLDWRLYGGDLPGYRLTNILLHVLVTLLVFGLAHRLLRDLPTAPGRPVWFAFLAALLFAVHPIHAEVVNSVFNRSSMLVALAGTGGLWWLLARYRAAPVAAWSGLALAYFLGMLSKESAVVLPGIAVVLVFAVTEGDWRARLRACVPVLWLLVPLALYFWLREQALTGVGPLAPDGSEAAGAPGGPALVEGPAPGAGSLGNLLGLPPLRVVLQAAAVWAESLRLMVWPDPLVLYHRLPAGGWQWAVLLAQVVLVGYAMFRALRGRPGLLIGLALFYVALLPASRLFGTLGELPHLAERYLYFPSVGIALLAAFGLRSLEGRLRPFPVPLTTIPVVLAAVALIAVGWARNLDWTDEVTLYEAELREGITPPIVLRLLTAAHLPQRNNARVTEICVEHRWALTRDGKYANQCGIAFAFEDRHDEAEQAFRAATNDWSERAVAWANLGMLNVDLRRFDEARAAFEKAIETERDPAKAAYRRGELLVMLHRRDRASLIQARRHFEEALRLDPRLDSARQWKRQLDRELGRR